MVLARVVVFLLAFGVGLAMIVKAEWIVRNFGTMDWAEKYMGPGGSYSAWKLFGVLLMIWGFLYATGTFDIAPDESLNLEPGGR